MNSVMSCSFPWSGGAGVDAVPWWRRGPLVEDEPHGVVWALTERDGLYRAGAEAGDRGVPKGNPGDLVAGEARLEHADTAAPRAGNHDQAARVCPLRRSRPRENAATAWSNG